MLFALVVYISHFIYFSPFNTVMIYIDPLYQFASLMVYPMYFIYLRILTVDTAFSFKLHFKYLIPPVLLLLLYLIGFIFSNKGDLEVWIYGRCMPYKVTEIVYLKIIFLLMRIVFVAQAIYLMTKSSKLLIQFADKAEQYYSDIEDTGNYNVKVINTSMIMTLISSVILAVLGRTFFNDNIILIAAASVTFSTLLFIIGWMGFKQKSASPISEPNLIVETKVVVDENIIPSQSVLLNKLLHLFEHQKVYLNENLNINHLAVLTGTNRTYISHLINNHFHQNFSTFVNTFRLEEVKKCILEDPTYTNYILAEKCGFNSADSMKRVVKNLSGLSVTELKSKILKENNSNGIYS